MARPGLLLAAAWLCVVVTDAALLSNGVALGRGGGDLIAMADGKGKDKTWVRIVLLSTPAAVFGSVGTGPRPDTP